MSAKILPFAGQETVKVLLTRSFRRLHSHLLTRTVYSCRDFFSAGVIMTGSRIDNLNIAVLLPCYNEASTIGAVVRGFKSALPGAPIHVYDNNSTDGTALHATLAGASVVRERR